MIYLIPYIIYILQIIMHHLSVCVCVQINICIFFQKVLNMEKAKVLLHDYKLCCCGGTQQHLHKYFILTIFPLLGS